MRKYILLLIFLILGFRITAFAADWMRAGDVEFTLENEPTIGGVAIIKIKAKVYGDIPNEAVSKARIYCGIPDGLEFINDKNYKTERKQDASKDWFNSVTLYEGPMKKDKPKEILFKVKVPDTKKYIVFGGVTGSGDRELEIDLGDPEPPEWRSVGKETVRGIGEKLYIRTGIKQVDSKGVSELDISKDDLPPLRTELRIRTKNRPYIKPPYNPQEIPLRYLVYTEIEAKNVEVTLELPEGLELINDKNYAITKKDKSTIINLYQGPMRFKECKAFYFKVRSNKKEHFRVKAQTRVVIADGKEFVAEDYQDIELGKVLY